MSTNEMRYAGTLAFSPEGTLFAADNTTGTIHAFEVGGGDAPEDAIAVEVDHIDSRIAEALGVSTRDVTINGMAVHPRTRVMYLSVSRRHDIGTVAAIITVDGHGTARALDLSAVKSSAYQIRNVPDGHRQFRSRAGDLPVPAAHKYHAKAQLPMRALSIVAMVFHDGELFVSGISNEEFSSTLRRIPVPFTGVENEARIRIYHTAHGRYETRAPIRAMQIITVDDQPTVVAAYTCSPLVLIPVSELADGAEVTGATIGDMGNGQPLHMVTYFWQGQQYLFVTNAARGPQVIPVAGLQSATAYTPDNAPAPMLLDLSPEMPLGPVGKTVMFVGSALHVALLNDRFFVAVVRDARSGDLNLESLPTGPLPIKLDQIWSEFDFLAPQTQA